MLAEPGHTGRGRSEARTDARERVATPDRWSRTSIMTTLPSRAAIRPSVRSATDGGISLRVEPLSHFDKVHENPEQLVVGVDHDLGGNIVEARVARRLHHHRVDDPRPVAGRKRSRRGGHLGTAIDQRLSQEGGARSSEDTSFGATAEQSGPDGGQPVGDQLGGGQLFLRSWLTLLTLRLPAGSLLQRFGDRALPGSARRARSRHCGRKPDDPALILVARENGPCCG